MTICVDGDPGSVGYRARFYASNMFAAIGVTIDWRRGFRGCPSPGIMISLTGHTPPSLRPGALAYALPYEGAHIRVFYDRIAHNYRQSLVPCLLAHVLVHEIAHILQGVSRHSESGIMKACWRQSDFDRMERKLLEFTPYDIDLIQLGLAQRTARALVAMNSAAAAVAVR